MQCTAHRHIWRCCWTLSPPWLSGNDVMRPADPAAAPSGCTCCRSVSFRLLSLLEAMLPDGLLQGITAADATPNGEDSTGMGPWRPMAAVVPVLRASSSSYSPPVDCHVAFWCSARCDCSEGLQRWHQDSSTCCKAEECDTQMLHHASWSVTCLTPAQRSPAGCISAGGTAALMLPHSTLCQHLCHSTGQPAQ